MNKCHLQNKQIDHKYLLPVRVNDLLEIKNLIDRKLVPLFFDTHLHLSK